MIEVRYGDASRQVHLVEGRSEQMMRWLVANAERVGQSKRTQITFHCVNEHVARVEIREFEYLDRPSDSC